MLEANRILARFEMSPDYPNMESLAIVGGSWAYPVRLPTTVGDMNVSVRAVSWSKLGLFDEATGYHFASPTPDQFAAAETYCSEAMPWPSPNSTAIVGSLGIVCLAS